MLNEVFPQLSKDKIKEGVVFGLEIRWLTKDEKFEEKMKSVEKDA